MELSRGKLRDSPLAALLLSARQAEATGALKIEANGTVSRLFLRRGQPRGALMGFGYRPLGQVLVENGLVDLEALDSALPAIEQGRPLEEVLLERGAIDRGSLSQAKRLQQQQHLRELIGLSEGSFEFEDKEPPGWTEEVELDPAWSLAEALSSPAGEEFAARMLAQLGPCFLQLGGDFEAVAEALRLEAADRKTLERLRQPGAVEDLVGKGLEPRRARILAAALVGAGALKRVEPSQIELARAERAAEELRLQAEKKAQELAAQIEAKARQDVEQEAHRRSELSVRLEDERRQREEELQQAEERAQAAKLASERAAATLEQARQARERAGEEARRAARELTERAERLARELEEKARAEAEEEAGQELGRARLESLELAQAVEEAQQARKEAQRKREQAAKEAAQAEERLRQAEAEVEIASSASGTDQSARIEQEARARAEELARRAAEEVRQRARVELEQEAARSQGLSKGLEEERAGREREEQAIAAAARRLEELEQRRSKAETTAKELSEQADQIGRELAEAAAARAEQQARAAREQAEREAEEAIELARKQAAELEARREEERQAAERARAEKARLAAEEELARRRAEVAERLEREAREQLERQAAERRAQEELRAAEAEAARKAQEEAAARAEQEIAGRSLEQELFDAPAEQAPQGSLEPIAPQAENAAAAELPTLDENGQVTGAELAAAPPQAGFEIAGEVPEPAFQPEGAPAVAVEPLAVEATPEASAEAPEIAAAEALAGTLDFASPSAEDVALEAGALSDEGSGLAAARDRAEAARQARLAEARDRQRNQTPVPAAPLAFEPHRVPPPAAEAAPAELAPPELNPADLAPVELTPADVAPASPEASQTTIDLGMEDMAAGEAASPELQPVADNSWISPTGTPAGEELPPVGAPPAAAGESPTGYLEAVSSLAQDVGMPEQLELGELYPGAPASPAPEAVPAQEPLFGAEAEAGIASAVEALATDSAGASVAPLLEAGISAALDQQWPGDQLAQAPSEPMQPQAVAGPAHAPATDDDIAIDAEPPPADWMHPPEDAVTEDPQRDAEELRALELAEEGDELSDPNEVRARRQKLLKRAFSNLGVLPSAEPKVEGGRIVEPKVEAARGESKTSAPAAIPSGPQQLPGEITAEEAMLATTIEAKAASIGKMDLFARLGIPRSAGRDQVKSAYFQQVKIFHPDRVPASLQHLQGKVREIFGALSEAHETLADDKRRAAYLTELNTPKPAAAEPRSRSSEAADAFAKQAEMALKKKEFARAAELFGRAYGDSKKADHLAQQAWAIYLDPEQKSALPQIKKMLEDALRQDAKCDRAAYSLGVIARVEGDLDKAERYFNQATINNPRHAEAATELRLIQMRRRKK